MFPTSSGRNTTVPINIFSKLKLQSENCSWLILPSKKASRKQFLSYCVYFCEKYENKMINVHPALIPSFCGKGFYGLHVHEAALKSGVKVTGATVHFVTAVCDGGPIILQKAVDVENNDTPETLQKRVMEQAEWKILPKAVSLFCEDRITVKDGRAYVNLKD